jgi:hypothetical protein
VRTLWCRLVGGKCRVDSTASCTVQLYRRLYGHATQIGTCIRVFFSPQRIVFVDLFASTFLSCIRGPTTTNYKTQRPGIKMTMLSSRSTLGRLVLIFVFLSEFKAANAFQTTSRFSPVFPRTAFRGVLSKNSSPKAPALFQSSITADLATTTTTAAAVEPDVKRVTSNDGPPPLGTILKMLPKESFVVDTQTSLKYFGIDLLAVMASLGFLNTVVSSDLYHSLPIWGQALTVAPLQVLVRLCPLQINMFNLCQFDNNSFDLNP